MTRSKSEIGNVCFGYCLNNTEQTERSNVYLWVYFVSKLNDRILT